MTASKASSTPTRRESVALFPASFDPVTNGHLDIMSRALRICDQIVLAVAVNVAKAGAFSIDERVAILEEVTIDEPRVQVTTFDTLSVDFAREVGANVILRGVRAMSDFEYEFEMALMNKHLDPDLETVFLMSSQEYLYVSSSRLKELVRFGRDVSEFVPSFVAKKLHEKLVKD
ncbi:MAG: pantetheine-phosphate adenylyltransferase [Myxococcales bacterium]|nr:pantetheine-phosphate adenylyltransferase [Myxococcales bacterium]